jgi:hypothetical protein
VSSSVRASRPQSWRHFGDGSAGAWVPAERRKLRRRCRERDDDELAAARRVPDPKVTTFDAAHMGEDHQPALVGCHECRDVAGHGQDVSRGDLQDGARNGPGRGRAPDNPELGRVAQVPRRERDRSSCHWFTRLGSSPVFAQVSASSSVRAIASPRSASSRPARASAQQGWVLSSTMGAGSCVRAFDRDLITRKHSATGAPSRVGTSREIACGQDSVHLRLTRIRTSHR